MTGSLPLAPQQYERVLQCYGYWGFGGGYARTKDQWTLPDGQFYCAACPLTRACWEAHRARVESIFPALVEEFKRLLAKHHDHGPSAVAEFHDLHGNADPYTVGMAANLEDGLAVGAGGAPKARGPLTLSYPFPTLT
jgi:hypothetical protein